MTSDQEITLITSLVGIFGVLLGVGLTSFFNLRIKSKEAQLRVLEKVFVRRLQAHEEVLIISRLLRTTVSTETADKNSNLITYPKILSNKGTLDQFIEKFGDIVNNNTCWIDIEFFRELNFVQDYLASVHMNVKDCDDMKFPVVALIITEDFVKIAQSLELETLKFFEKNIHQMKIKTKKQHHKYKIFETKQRLNNTELLKSYKRIKKIAEG